MSPQNTVWTFPFPSSALQTLLKQLIRNIVSGINFSTELNEEAKSLNLIEKHYIGEQQHSAVWQRDRNDMEVDGVIAPRGDLQVEKKSMQERSACQ